ncbi:MAG: methyltransferase domain-containing protein, partial [Proteobacteria bacterium]|nr:methyltransferase domain-containing protein [Pseudomonadota bacterium]
MAEYPPEFYRSHGETALASARCIVPIVLDLLTAQRVVDIGCGSGAWLAVFREHGVEDILGLDGVWIDEGELKIPH